MTDDVKGENVIDVQLPKALKLEEKDMALLRKFSEEGRSIQQFVQLVVDQGAARMEALGEKQKQAWAELDKKYGLEVATVNWVLADDGESIVPVTMRLK